MLEFVKGISRKSYHSIEKKGGVNMKLSKGILATLCAVVLLLVPVSAVMAVLEPAVYTITDLVVEPSPASVGQTVTVTATINNVSSEDGDNPVELEINGEVVDSINVALNGGNPVLGYNSEVIEFTFTPSEAGTYTVAVSIPDQGILETTLTVTGGTPAPTATLTMAVNGSGSTTPAAGAQEYPEGDTVTITATAASGWQFDNWTGDVANSNSATTTVTMNTDKTVTANFSETTPPPDDDETPLNIWVISGSILGVLVVGGVVYYFVRR